MRSSLQILLTPVLVLGLWWSGCSLKPRTVQAAQVALEASNEKAKRLYQIEPFTAEDGDWRVTGEGSVWEALTSVRGKDFIAKVTFDAGGSVASVDVQMLVHPTVEPQGDEPDIKRPDTREPTPIPEIVPEEG